MASYMAASAIRCHHVHRWMEDSPSAAHISSEESCVVLPDLSFPHSHRSVVDHQILSTVVAHQMRINAAFCAVESESNFRVAHETTGIPILSVFADPAANVDWFSHQI